MYRYRYLIKSILILIPLIIAALIIIFIYNSGEKSIAPLVVNVNDESTAPETLPTTIVTELTENTQKKNRQDFLDLMEMYSNDEIVGYLKIEGTTIDYPVVQHTDNEFYLEKNIYKEPDVSGWVFLDYENSIVNFDKNTIIYGHNMKQDIMFHALRNYRSEDFFNEHRYIVFNTLYEDTVWEVFSFMKTHVSLNYLQVQPNDKEYKKLLSDIKSQSMYDTGVDVNITDKILNLSTCSVDPAESMYRYVLSAKLVDICN